MDDGIGPVEALIGLVLVMCVAWLGGSWLASLVFDQGLLQAGPRPAWDAAMALPDHLGDPASGWADPYRSRLPGPVPYYLSLVGFVVLVVALLQLLRGLWSASVGQKSRTRLGRKVVGRMARRRETITLAVKPGSGAPG
ncbi:MAG: hypothetical protein KDB24_16185, partial [Microthrixaceae bacterium]|nr:hypothetical protein [Microthrixaceae bacterium]